MNLYLLNLSWKNLWRNQRRTLLTVSAIGFGLAFMVYLYNYYEAFHNQLVENAIRFHSGHLLVVPPGHDPDRLTTPKPLAYTPALRRWLSDQKEIRSFSPQIVVQGLVSSPRASANILIKGVDPALEEKNSSFARETKVGKFLPEKAQRPIVLGKKLQEILQVKLGEKVVLLTQGVDGSIGNELFTVAGVFETRSEWDKSLAFVRLSAARSLLSLPDGRVHQIPVVLDREASTRTVQSRLQRDLKELHSLTWAQVQKHLVALIELDRAFHRVLLVILLAIVALGIVNSILMSVLERKREFGVMLAIGTTKGEIVRLVAAETFLMASVGVAFGNLLGFLVTLYFQHYGFDLLWLTDQQVMVNGAVIQTVSYPSMHWANCWLVSLSILLLSLAIAVLPARYIARLRPVVALRG